MSCTPGKERTKKRPRECCWEWIALAAITLLFFGAQLFFLMQGQAILWDELAYISNARAIVGDSAYVEAFRNPMLPTTVAGLWLFTGESLLAARLLIVILACASLVLTYLIARHHTRYALWITTALAANATFFFWSGYVYADVPGVFLTLLGIWTFRKGKWGLITTGAAFCLAFLTRFANGISFGVLFLVLLYWREWRRVLYATIGFAIPCLIWLVSNLIRFGNPFYDFIVLGDLIITHTWRQPMLPFLLTTLKLQWPLFVAIIAGAVVAWQCRKLEKAPARQALLWGLCGLVFLIFHGVVMLLKLERYTLAFLPFVLVLAAIMLGALERSGRSALQPAIVWPLLVTMLILSVPALNQQLIVKEWKITCAERDALRDAAGLLDEHMAADGFTDGKLSDGSPVRIISNAWPYFGWYNNVQAHALYTTNWTEIHQNITPQYVLYTEQVGDRYPFEDLQENDFLEYRARVEGPCDVVWLWRARHPPWLYYMWARE